MEKVLGIGGLFFRARDSTVLAQWHETHLDPEKNPIELWQPNGPYSGPAA